MIIKKLLLRPKLIIFDLDHTLWPFGVDRFDYKPPYRKTANGQIVDKNQQVMNCYTDVPTVLRKLSSDGYDMAVASRTEYPEGANHLINLFDWDKYFKYREIYPGSKITHFGNFQTKSKYNYNEMIFFDDEERNIIDISPLGVTAILVDRNHGITLKVVNDGLLQFASSRSKG